MYSGIDEHKTHEIHPSIQDVDLCVSNLNPYRSRDMASVILALILGVSYMEAPVDDDYSKEAAYELFWPPDMVPHPMPPIDDSGDSGIA